MSSKQKKIGILLILAFCFVQTNLFANEISAVEYLEKIFSQFNNLEAETWEYIKIASHSKSINAIEKQRKKLIKSIQRHRKDVAKMEGFNDDLHLKNATLKYLDLTYAVISEDYKAIVDMKKVSEESYDAMEAYFMAKDIASKKLEKSGNILQQATKVFATNNNITLTENKSEFSQKIAVAEEVYGYYNEFYLVFFKSYKQEAYLIAALDIGDISQILQNKKALISTTKEGLQKLKRLKAYKNDSSIKKALEKTLLFYNKEATDSLTVIEKYYQQHDKFEKIQKAMDKKKKKDITQEDVDAFNKEVNLINELSEKFNITMTELNEERSNLLNEWNVASETFKDVNIPK